MVNIPFPPAGYSEDVFKRVRVAFNGHFIADAQTPKFVYASRFLPASSPTYQVVSSWEHVYWPFYYVPESTVKSEYLKNGVPSDSGNGTTYDIVAGGRTAPRAATIFNDGPFAGYAKIIPGDPLAWFEEDERIWFHPRDPYKVRKPSAFHVAFYRSTSVH